MKGGLSRVRIGGEPMSGVPEDPIWRMNTDRYHQMFEAGVLTEDDPVELLEGWLVEKVRKTPQHSMVTGLMRRELERLTKPGFFVAAHDPFTTEDSEPEPDGTVVRGEPKNYAGHHPGPKDIALVVEISDATLQRDRTIKLRIYARAAIPIFWIVNLIDGHIEVYADPTGPAEQPTYRQRTDFGPADDVPLIINGREIGRIAVRDILP